ncbi:MAG TPA: IPT/TIG domain-containing protein [Actinomycetota bacterium]|nr:IPT/TIG domain-containing protein [Actinomycetota bacterium]
MARNLAPTPEDIQQANEPPGPGEPPEPSGPGEPPEPPGLGEPPEPPGPPGGPPGSAVQVQVGSSVAFASWVIVLLFLAIGLVFQVATFSAPKVVGGTVFGLKPGRLQAIALGFGLVGTFLLLLQILGNGLMGGDPEGAKEAPLKRKPPGVFRPIIGADGRFSTGLTQLALWTLAIGTGLGFLLGRSMFEGVKLTDVLPAGTWDDYLILLGGPFAAAVLAKGIVTYKLDAGTLQKSEPAAPTITQVATNDHGSVDLVDSQYLLFNIIALGYFVITIINTAVLPTMHPTLLAMTSGTAALYVANKAVQRNAPSITSVSPRTAAPGDLVTILGGNFDPGDRGDSQRRITLTISGYQRTLYPQPTSDTRALFVVPDDVLAGSRTITLTSSAGVETEPQDIEILPSGIDIVEASPSYVQPGERMTLVGRNFRADQEPRVIGCHHLAERLADIHSGQFLAIGHTRAGDRAAGMNEEQIAVA